MNVKEADAKEAFSELLNNNNAYLIDVRTEAEWQNIGAPNFDTPIKGKLIFLSLRLAPNMEFNSNFTTQLVKLIEDEEAELYFLCATGVRSHHAALIAIDEGFKNCYNIIDGFNGTDQNNGWKNKNLPWKLLK